MLKLLAKILPLLLLCNMALSQSTGVKLKVVDKATGQPLSFVDIVVYQDNNEIYSTQTDNNGAGKINPPQGAIDIKVTYKNYYTLFMKGVNVSGYTNYRLKFEMVQNDTNSRA